MEWSANMEQEKNLLLQAKYCIEREKKKQIKKLNIYNFFARNFEKERVGWWVLHLGLIVGCCVLHVVSPIAAIVGLVLTGVSAGMFHNRALSRDLFGIKGKLISKLKSIDEDLAEVDNRLSKLTDSVEIVLEDQIVAKNHNADEIITESTITDSQTSTKNMILQLIENNAEQSNDCEL